MIDTGRLFELSRVAATTSPVVSLYLDTRWTDQHQRERARVFVKNEVTRARKDVTSATLEADLDWVEAEARSLVNQAAGAAVPGAALFACEPLGLREVVPLRAPCVDLFVVADRPYLRPLADALTQSPEALVAWVDAEHARLVPVTVYGAGEGVTLESDVPGHHRRGGWALLAQSRYQRHIADQRARHLTAVAETLVQLVHEGGVRRIVLAGEPETVRGLREHLPLAMQDRIAGVVRGSRYEAPAVIVERALDLLAAVELEARIAAVDSVITEAAKAGRAASGLASTLEAVRRGAVHRLYLLNGFCASGVTCRACGLIEAGVAPTCGRCGDPTTVVELGEAIVERVLASGGTVEPVAHHGRLAERGGIAALLRYPIAVPAEQTEATGED